MFVCSDLYELSRKKRCDQYGWTSSLIYTNFILLDYLCNSATKYNHNYVPPTNLTFFGLRGKDCKHIKTLHYKNTPMQYTVIFHGCKNNNFQMKNCDIFLNFAVNIHRGYTLEPPQ